MKKIFIGSSSQAFDKALVIQSILEKLGAKTTLWQDSNVFPPSEYLFEALLKAAHGHSGGVFIFDRDDRASCDTGETSKWLPRDNVILEAGIFAGVLGEGAIALCKVPGVHQATDIDGKIYIPYDPVHMEDMEKKLEQWLNNSVKDYREERFNTNVLMLSRTKLHKLISVDSRFHISDNNYKDIRCIRIMNLAGSLIINPEMADYGQLCEMKDLQLSDVLKMILSKTKAKVEYILTEPNPYNLTDAATKIVNKGAGSTEQTIISALREMYSKLTTNTVYQKRYKNVPVTFYLYLLKISMPYGILNVEFGNRKYNHVKVDLYSCALTEDHERRSFIIWQEDDPDNYNFFINNFISIKNNRSISTEIKGEAGLESLQKWLT